MSTTNVYSYRALYPDSDERCITYKCEECECLNGLLQLIAVVFVFVYNFFLLVWVDLWL